jgi:glucose-6-phosphate-specific signal transduction histidine kinase
MKHLNRRLAKFFALIGPWPIEPFHMGALTFFMVASLYSLGENLGNGYVSESALLRPVFSASIAILTYLQLRVTIRILPGYKKSFALYLFLLVIQSFSIWSWIVFFRSTFPAIHSSFTAFLSPVPLIRFMFTLLCINAFIGLSRARLSQALEQKEEALRVQEEQSTLLLEYDETTRTQLSEFLHDRVQSSLVTACLELQNIKSKVDSETGKSISRIIDSLENLRAVDVRNAAQTLSPAVGNADISTSIMVMTHNYAPAVSVKLAIAPEIELLQGDQSRELFLGMYRIIEQSFLNSLIHGKATAFEVRIYQTESAIHLATLNNGEKIPVVINQGLGSAIINSWVRTLNGTWSFSNNNEGQAELIVRLPRIE